ncbi:MAG: hypothetical protein H6907_08415 [Hyphomicrobiales bacterium]|nr:hypothetical protein [Hyphomicrobiales bacterium]
MKDLFLGKPLHWLLLVALMIPFAVMGYLRVHVSQFNHFVLLMLGLAALVVVLVVVPHRHGERITREPLEDESDAD